MDWRLAAAPLKRAPEGFAVDGDDIGSQFRKRSDPGDEAILKSFGIVRRKQIAERIMGWRAVLEGPETA